MTGAMLSRRLMIVGAAVGLPVMLRVEDVAAQSADVETMSCDYNLIVAKWESYAYSTSCNFKTTATSEILSKRVIRTEHEPDTWFDLTASEVPSLTLHFRNLIMEPRIDLAKLSARLTIDGKPVWEKASAQPGVEAKHDSFKFVGNIDEVVAAMRGGEVMRVDLYYLTEEPLTTLEYSLRGFDSAYEAWEKHLAELKSRLQAGVQCLPKGNPTCYFTTAACGAAGLPDNCFELTMLRSFRDAHMLATQKGSDEVAEYYDLAPKILNALRQRSDAERHIARLYAFVVLPCALLISVGCDRLAYGLYRRSFNRLKALVG